MTLRPTIAGCSAIAVAVFAFIVLVQNVLLTKYFPHLERVPTDFSGTYLRRELADMARRPPATVFLGDSVLWGYDLPASATAVALLRERGYACRNLAFKSSSPPNYDALVLLMRRAGVRPRAVVVEVNQKVLNSADASYQTLHPALAALSEKLMPPADLAKLAPPTTGANHFGTLLERDAESVSTLYAMRSDLRALVAEPSARPEPPPSADALEGTYDLSPLDASNVGVHFLTASVAALRSEQIPVVAFLTPTNHRLLHDYIDSPQYRRNNAYLARTLTRLGARVIDLDAAFPAADFLDNDHLTVAGQRRLADALQRTLAIAD